MNLKKLKLTMKREKNTQESTTATRQNDYAVEFLKKRGAVQKRQTYISAAHFAKLTKILAVVASDLSVPTFLDNLIDHHLDTHRDEINDLYRRETEKPL